MNQQPVLDNRVRISTIFSFHRLSNAYIQLSGRLAGKIYDGMKRQAAAVKIQKNTRRHEARKAYCTLRVSVLVLQTGLRAREAHKRFTYRRQTKAATVIQVSFF